jgi:uncharacterized membrane protein
MTILIGSALLGVTSVAMLARVVGILPPVPWLTRPRHRMHTAGLMLGLCSLTLLLTACNIHVGDGH